MNTHASLIFKLIALAVIACVPLSGESFYIEIIGKVLVMAIFAMSLDLLVGFTGLVSFGHAAYFGIAAYAVALFMAGCGGDQNPYPRGTIELAEQHGLTLATAVAAALQTRPRAVRGPLRIAYDHAVIDYAPAPTVSRGFGGCHFRGEGPH